MSCSLQWAVEARDDLGWFSIVSKSMVAEACFGDFGGANMTQGGVSVMDELQALYPSACGVNQDYALFELLSDPFSEDGSCSALMDAGFPYDVSPHTESYIGECCECHTQGHVYGDAVRSWTDHENPLVADFARAMMKNAAIRDIRLVELPLDGEEGEVRAPSAHEQAAMIRRLAALPAELADDAWRVLVSYHG